MEILLSTGIIQLVKPDKSDNKRDYYIIKSYTKRLRELSPIKITQHWSIAAAHERDTDEWMWAVIDYDLVRLLPIWFYDPIQFMITLLRRWN
jgi:hypothetical protein